MVFRRDVLLHEVSAVFLCGVRLLLHEIIVPICGQVFYTSSVNLYTIGTAFRPSDSGRFLVILLRILVACREKKAKKLYDCFETFLV